MCDKLYKLLNRENGNVSWFTDEEELFFILKKYGNKKHEISVYEYELVEIW